MKKAKAISLLKKKKTAKPPLLTAVEFLRETSAVRSDILQLKKEMNERFERHENIILAEYRHRIEDLEGKVRALEAKAK